MGVRNINLHQISGNSKSAFLSLCHQFYRPTIGPNPKAHARNLKLRKMHKMETAFDYLDLFNAYVRKFTIKAIRIFVSVDVYLVFGPHTYSRRHLENDVIGATLWHFVLHDARTFERHGFYGSLP